MIHLLYPLPQKISIGIVLDFSWDILISQENYNDYATFCGVKEVSYGICASREYNLVPRLEERGPWQ